MIVFTWRAELLRYDYPMDTKKLILENIDKSLHLSLATSHENKPWVSEVHFAYDDNFNLYWRSLPSTRHSKEITANPNVAGNIVKQHRLEDSVVGLYFEGTAKVLGPGPELDDAFKALSGRIGVTEADLEEAKQPEGHRFYKITVENWYIFGKFDETGARKHKLAR